ncbi:Ferritin-3, chloroplastic [Glycine soja]|uniref:Ferritin n=1 Tax=Glycine soja TaxID=3848 RepID=A0A445KLI3_GLYSO|nr:Ferritin-3, chloroplastic [Glycine soja]
MELALLLEKLTNEKLLNLHSVASKSNDAQLSDFIESEFLGEQVEAIKKISEYVAQLRRVGKGHDYMKPDPETYNWVIQAYTRAESYDSKSTERPNNLIFSGARVKAISIVGSNLAFFSVMQTKLDFVPENVSTLAWL